VLDRIASNPVFQRLNEGDAYGMGESVGVGAEQGRERALALKSVCLWCDEFMARYIEPSTLSARSEPQPGPGRTRKPVT
jgi:hypothetical protein